MLAQFAGDDVLAQLLLDALFIVLRNLDNAVDFSINIGLVDVLQPHSILLLTHSKLKAR